MVDSKKIVKFLKNLQLPCLLKFKRGVIDSLHKNSVLHSFYIMLICLKKFSWLPHTQDTHYTPEKSGCYCLLKTLLAQDSSFFIYKTQDT